MIRSLRFLSREVRGMHQAAYVLAAFSLGSQVLALVRDRLLAAVFGAGTTLDIYYAAFRLPDFIFATVASLFSLYALLPILSRIEAEREGFMIGFLRTTLLAFFSVLSFIALIAFVLAPVLAPIVAPGIADGARGDLVTLMRILLLQPILLGASNTIAALTQLRHRFVLYSISPVLYNLGIIIGAAALYPLWGVAGLGWGVVLGAAMHMGIQLPYFLAERPVKYLGIARVVREMREVLLLSIPRTLALSSTQIALLGIIAMASFLAPGSITVLTFALNLQAVPLTIIGVSYSVAAFPTLAQLYSQGKREQFVSYIEAAVRHIVFWSIPAIFFIIVLRAQLVRVILGVGAFDWVATRLTAAALAILILALVAQALTMLIARTYYATGNSRKPLYFGIADIVVSLSSAVGLTLLFHSNVFVRAFVESLLRVEDVPGTTVLMLTLGYALGAIIEFAIGYAWFVRDFALPPERITRLAFQSIGASIVGAAIAYEILAFLGTFVQPDTVLGIVGQGAVAGVVGLAITVGLLHLLHNKELEETIASLRRRFKDLPPVAVEPSDVASAS